MLTSTNFLCPPLGTSQLPGTSGRWEFGDASVWMQSTRMPEGQCQQHYTSLLIVQHLKQLWLPTLSKPNVILYYVKSFQCYLVLITFTVSQFSTCIHILCKCIYVANEPKMWPKKQISNAFNRKLTHRLVKEGSRSTTFLLWGSKVNYSRVPAALQSICMWTNVLSPTGQREHRPVGLPVSHRQGRCEGRRQASLASTGWVREESRTGE